MRGTPTLHVYFAVTFGAGYQPPPNNLNQPKPREYPQRARRAASRPQKCTSDKCPDEDAEHSARADVARGPGFEGEEEGVVEYLNPLYGCGISLARAHK